MLIQSLAPLTAQEYGKMHLERPMAAGTHPPDPLELFAPTLQAVQKLAFAPYFWFIIDYPALRCCDVAPKVHEHVPADRPTWLSSGLSIPLSLIHPDDLGAKFALDYLNETHLGRLPPAERAQLTFCSFVRSLHRSGQYRWYMVQMADHFYDQSGKIIYSLRVCYDISHLKKEGVPMMTLLDKRQPDKQLFFCHTAPAHQAIIDKLLQLTDRELQVVRLLAAGHLTKQVAAQLGISPNTVENHKHNIFQKTQTRSLAELVAFAVRNEIA
jgi:DNA-binding CsgD family transcriptional regulator